MMFFMNWQEAQNALNKLKNETAHHFCPKRISPRAA